MKCYIFIGFLGLIGNLEAMRLGPTYCCAAGELNDKTDKTLILTHVLFRHGHRTSELSERYPLDPYLNKTYFPTGIGQLTNEGKQREFRIGLALRNTYDSFLGEYYYPEIIDATSTNYNRTKMSLELVLAGLFAPKNQETWNNHLNWQPVPYNFLPQNNDKILLGVNCPYYQALYNVVRDCPKTQEAIQKYHNTFEYLTKNTGKEMKTFLDTYNLFFGLTTEQELGLKLPKWTMKVWPQKITQMAINEYYVATANTEMVQMASGYFIQKVIEDSKTKARNLNEEHGRKMYMYSAHENNIAELLILLGLFPIQTAHVPTYGSYIVIEVHNINNVIGLKIFYQNYSTPKPQLLKLAACDAFCPLDQFERLLEEYLPPASLCTKSLTSQVYC